MAVGNSAQHGEPARARVHLGGSRRRVPYVVVGALLVIACAAAAVITVMQLDRRVGVLVLARPVVVGHVLSAQDFRQAAVSAGTDLAVVPVADASSVLGRPVAYTLPAGALLTRGVVGAPRIPVTGQGVVALGLRAGQFPPSLSPGARIAVVVAAANTKTGGDSAPEAGQQQAPVGQWTATVVEVAGSGQDAQNTVIALQLPEGDARQLAAVPAGQVGLVAVNAGGS